MGYIPEKGYICVLKPFFVMKRLLIVLVAFFAITTVASANPYKLDEASVDLAIENAVAEVLKTTRTPDIYTEGTKKVSTVEMGDAVCALI